MYCFWLLCRWLVKWIGLIVGVIIYLGLQQLWNCDLFKWRISLVLYSRESYDFYIQCSFSVDKLTNTNIHTLCVCVCYWKKHYQSLSKNSVVPVCTNMHMCACVCMCDSFCSLTYHRSMSSLKASSSQIVMCFVFHFTVSVNCSVWYFL